MKLTSVKYVIYVNNGELELKKLIASYNYLIKFNNYYLKRLEI